MVEWVDIYQRLLWILDVRNLGDVALHTLRLVVIITIRLLPGLFGRWIWLELYTALLVIQWGLVVVVILRIPRLDLAIIPRSLTVWELRLVIHWVFEEVCVHVAVDVHSVIASSCIIDNLWLIKIIPTFLTRLLLLQNILNNVCVQIFFEELGKHQLKIGIVSTIQMMGCGWILVEGCLT